MLGASTSLYEVNWIYVIDARAGKIHNNFHTIFGDPIGTEDLFAKWNRARQR
jgi:hypothetical protein